jgi:hypothetical protein
VAVKTIHHRTGSKPRKSGAQLTIAAFILALAVLGGILAGCVPATINPLYRQGDLVEDPALLGVWNSGEGKDHWKFTSGEGKSYALEIQSDEQKTIFVAHLFKLGDERFLDVYPEEHALGAKLQNTGYDLMLIPGHLFFRVHAVEPKLRMSNMGLDWLKELLKRDPKAAAHVVLPDERVVLTGETDALQAFVKNHLKDTNAWDAMYEDGLVKAAAKPAEK